MLFILKLRVGSAVNTMGTGKHAVLGCCIGNRIGRSALYALVRDSSLGRRGRVPNTQISTSEL